MKINLFAGLVFLLFSGCDLEREIEVKLPRYDKQLVVEAYLERDKPLQVLVSESDPYFDTLRLPIFNAARVRLQMDNQVETLPNFPVLNFETRKLTNYQQETPFPVSESAQYQLVVEDDLGRRLEGKTRFLPLPQLDSVEVRYAQVRGEWAASLLVWIQDFPNQSNYYRIIMNEDSLTGSPAVEFTFTDAGQDGKRFPVGTSYRFKPGKTMYIRLFHLEQGYYQYLRSMNSAANANGNPFAQPATVASPMTGGGFGIFTTLNYRQVVKGL